jgi:hypothetical protein
VCRERNFCEGVRLGTGLARWVSCKGLWNGKQAWTVRVVVHCIASFSAALIQFSVISVWGMLVNFCTLPLCSEWRECDGENLGRSLKV